MFNITSADVISFLLLLLKILSEPVPGIVLADGLGDNIGFVTCDGSVVAVVTGVGDGLGVKVTTGAGVGVGAVPPSPSAKLPPPPEPPLPDGFLLGDGDISGIFVPVLLTLKLFVISPV